MEFVFEAEGFPEGGLEELKVALAAELGGEFTADAPLKAELLLVSEEEIRELNNRFRKKDAVTDVLSFPAMELKSREIKKAEHRDSLDGDMLYLGSIVVCEKRAREQAEEYGHAFERELYYLAVHGVLHCMGYDHETEAERADMRRTEEAVMRRMRLSRD